MLGYACKYTWVFSDNKNDNLITRQYLQGLYKVVSMDNSHTPVAHASCVKFQMVDLKLKAMAH